MGVFLEVYVWLAKVGICIVLAIMSGLLFWWILILFLRGLWKFITGK